jgi:putative oxidoreductase
MNHFWERTGTVIGRLLLALIFIASGVGKAMTFNKTEGQVTGIMTKAGIPGPAVPALLVVAIVFEIVGGLSVLTGFMTRWGALMLIIFLIAVTPIFHIFWNIPENDPQHQEQMVNFMKNVAIGGGLLILIARGGGLCSLDNLRRGKVQPSAAGTERKAA